MNRKSLMDVLKAVENKGMTAKDAAEKLALLPYETIDCATIDHHRSLMKGWPEVVFGEGKTPEQIISIMERFVSAGDNCIVTRLSRDKADHLLACFPDSEYHPMARILTNFKKPVNEVKNGYILVVSAGTSDQPVAEEAIVTAMSMGHRVERLFDVGVAGIHRLFDKMSILRNANVLIVVAGMEGALPSVIAGLVSAPVIAVPTSVGYGANFKGLSALLAMLNSCANGVSVVNIDNGFGAAYMAAVINRRTCNPAE